MSKFIGIDTGNFGAIVVYDSAENRIVDSLCLDVSDDFELYEFLKQWGGSLVLVEEICVSYGSGVRQCFGFGMSYGRMKTAMNIAGVTSLGVSSNRWSAYFRKQFGGVLPSEDNKKRNERWVVTHFPGMCDFAKKVKRYHSGIIDAFLIAYYFSKNYDTLLREKSSQKTKPKRKKSAPKAAFL